MLFFALVPNALAFLKRLLGGTGRLHRGNCRSNLCRTTFQQKVPEHMLSRVLAYDHRLYRLTSGIVVFGYEMLGTNCL